MSDIHLCAETIPTFTYFLKPCTKRCFSVRRRSIDHLYPPFLPPPHSPLRTEAWISQYERGQKDVVDLLRRVADFFYNVVLAFAIRYADPSADARPLMSVPEADTAGVSRRDFNMLVVRYIQKTRETFFADPFA